MRNRRKTIIAIAVVLAIALAAGVFLTSGRDQSPSAKPAAGSRLLSPFTGERWPRWAGCWR